MLELLQNESTLAEIASKHNILPQNLVNWKKTFLANAEIAMEPSKAVKEYKEELILHESMTSILAWIWRRSDTYDNHQMSSVLEDYFAGNTSKYYKGVSVN